MDETANTKVIQEAFAAFGRGDAAAILERIDDNVVWNGVYGTNATVPT
jgi:ketosteroid isomerase-like protein